MIVPEDRNRARFLDERSPGAGVAHASVQIVSRIGVYSSELVASPCCISDHYSKMFAGDCHGFSNAPRTPKEPH